MAGASSASDEPSAERRASPFRGVRAGFDRLDASLARFRLRAASWHILLVMVAVGAALVAQRASGTGPAFLWNEDMPKIDFPLAVFFHDAVTHGRLPLWNDDLGLGFPLYAEGQIGAFYPPNWLIFQLPPLTALDVTRLLHLTMAGVGAGWLAVRVSGSRAGALVACLVAVLGGAIVTKLEWTNLVAAYGWMPWVLLPLSRRPGPTRAGLVASGICWGIQALAGHPNTWFLTGVAAVVLMLALAPNPRTLLRVGGFGVLGIAVGAVQILPTLLLTTLSVRSLGVSADDAFTSSSTGFDPLGFAFANVFVLGQSLGWNPFSVWYPDGIFALLESSAYVGLPVLALVAVGARSRRMRPWLVVAVALAAIPVVAAFRPTPWLSVPILNGLRSPVRAYLVVGLLLGLVAAAGVARVHLERRAWLLGGALVAALAAFYALTLIVAEQAPGFFDTLMRAFSTNLDDAGAEAARSRAIAALTEPLPLLAELALGAAAVALLVVRRPRRLVAGALVVVAAIPLLVFSPQANELRPESSFSWANTPFDQALIAVDAHRVVTLNRPGWYEGMPDQLAASGVPDLEMFSSLDLLATDDLLDQARRQADAADIRRAIGVDVVVDFGEPCPGEQVGTVDNLNATICRTEDALHPPYWIPASAVLSVVGGSTLPILGEPTRPAQATLDVSAVVGDAQSANVVSWGTEADEFTVDAPADGYVWIDRAWWPGWQTTIDGRTVQPLQALAGQLVAVPAGHHDIRQSLVPWDAYLGLLAGLVAVSLAAAWVALGRWTGLRDRLVPGRMRPRAADG